MLSSDVWISGEVIFLGISLDETVFKQTLVSFQVQKENHEREKKYMSHELKYLNTILEHKI